MALVEAVRDDDGSFSVRDKATGKVGISRLAQEDAQCLASTINHAFGRETLRRAFAAEAARNAARENPEPQRKAAP